MVWEKRGKEVNCLPLYDVRTGHFTIDMRHGGSFGGNGGRKRYYVNGDIGHFDYCHGDELSLLELRSMAKELGLHASSEYFVRVGKNYSQINSDVDAMNLYKHVDENRIVHVYAAVDVQHSGRPSTSHGVLRRSPRKQQRIRQLEGERGIQSDAYDPYSSSSPDDDPFYPDSEWDRRDGDDKDYDIFVDENEQDVLNCSAGSIEVYYDSMAENIEGFDEDDMPSDDLHNLDSNLEEDVGDGTKKNPIFNEKTDFDNPMFCVGMEFKTHELFRDAVKEYAIKWGKNIRFTENDTKKVRAVCKEGCPWMCYASFVKSASLFRVKTFISEHNCTRTFNQRHVTCRWIMRRYQNMIKQNPTWPIDSLTTTISEEWNMKVMPQTVRRAKRKIIQILEGTTLEQFQQLRSYAYEICRTNLGTTFVINDNVGKDDKGKDICKFKWLYICWGSLKRGFL
ncbi:hypothetical protein Dimus_038694 [Dionaea muscipula]